MIAEAIGHISQWEDELGLDETAHSIVLGLTEMDLHEMVSDNSGVVPFGAESMFTVDDPEIVLGRLACVVSRGTEADDQDAGMTSKLDDMSVEHRYLTRIEDINNLE
jgi:hypothetical protein